MTYSRVALLPTLQRSVIALAAIATSATLLMATATPSSASAPAYRIVSAQGAKVASKVILRDTLWTCAENVCVANSINSRPEIVCATAARKIGKLDSFTAAGREFNAEELAKCNAKAK